MKHYILKFCQDHGDEFDVHALTCFTDRFRNCNVQYISIKSMKYDKR